MAFAGHARARTMAWVAMAVAILLRTPPGAGDEGLQVEWTAPPSCPSQASVRARVDALLHGGTQTAAGAAMIVEARAQAMDDGTWTVELDLASDGETRRRTIPGGRDCAEAAEAAAVVIAIAIDPEAASRAVDVPEQDPVQPGDAARPDASSIPAPVAIPEPEPQPEPEPEPEPDPEPLALPRPIVMAGADAPSPRGPRPRGLLAAFGAVGFGNLPGVAGGLGVEGGVLLPRVRVTASALYWFRRRARVDTAAIDFRQWSAAVRVCPVFAVHRIVEVLACGGIEVGQTIVRTTGLSGGDEPEALWLAWLVQPALVVMPRPWIGVRVAPELFGPFWLMAYDLRPGGEVFRVRPVGIRGLVALEVRFP